MTQTTKTIRTYNAYLNEEFIGHVDAPNAKAAKLAAADKFGDFAFRYRIERTPKNYNGLGPHAS